MKLITCLAAFILSISFSSTAQTSCDSWVKLNDRFAAVTVGDLDVTGDKVTVEAVFNMTGPSVNIVSKHWGGFDVNYLLRPVRAEIATTNSGFVHTDEGAFPCNDSMEYNKTYHVALVYNGSMLKFYRNGILVSEVPASGDLLTNDWNTAIGEHAPVVTPVVNGVPNPDYRNQNEGQGFYDESFRGFINEVRIWNIARSQEDIRTYMNTQLPDPANQAGLLGYWVFDSLKNKQGNSAYDGSIEGLAEIAQTNTTCNGIPDSCDVFLPCKYIALRPVEPQEGKITLNWKTEAENEIVDYDVQRSASASFNQFQLAGSVSSVNATGVHDYVFTDDDLSGATDYFYRLGIKHRNGPTSHSAIIHAKALPVVTPPSTPAATTTVIYPNPSKDGHFILRFNSSAGGDASLMIYNSNGSIVQRRKITVIGGVNNIPLDLAVYQKGNYFIKLITKGGTTVKNLMKF